MLLNKSSKIMTAWIVGLYFVLAGVLLYSGFGSKVLSLFGINTATTMHPWNQALFTITVVSVISFFIVPFLVGFLHSMQTKELISQETSKEVSKCVVWSVLLLTILAFVIFLAYGVINKIPDLQDIPGRWKEFFPFAVAQPGTYIFLASLFVYCWEICFSLSLGSRLYFSLTGRK